MGSTFFCSKSGRKVSATPVAIHVTKVQSVFKHTLHFGHVDSYCLSYRPLIKHTLHFGHVDSYCLSYRPLFVLQIPYDPIYYKKNVLPTLRILPPLYIPHV